ncbi:hypothetical protein B1R38_06070 [Bacillus cereus]|nr:hypothetical protein B1R38_06070 [Bacillus cereus]
MLNRARLSNELLSNKNPLKIYFKNQKGVFKSIITCTQLKSFEEGYSGFNTLIKEVCIEKLIAELIIGQYSFPYITNINSQLSLKYKEFGKETWMYSDVLYLISVDMYMICYQYWNN